MTQTFFGHRILVEPLRPRYVLPDDVSPPPGMTRDEFADWSRRVCGHQAPLIKDGQVFYTEGAMHMNQATFDAMKAKLPGWAK